ncbi:DUF3515 family protein [Actinomycetes bacterium KLBMP 9797]
MDRTTRQAALWATVVAVPLTALVAVFAINAFAAEPDPEPTPSATTPGPRSTAPVALAAPALSVRAATVCRALTSQLPATVQDLAQRPVTAGPEQNAAYGDPAITVSCGGAPVSFPPDTELWVLSGVCWHLAERSDATVWTTVDREVPVRVTVPRAYEEAAQRTIAFSPTIVATVPSLTTLPSGCRG